jgi:DNA-binding NtrC family response regulator
MDAEICPCGPDSEEIVRDPVPSRSRVVGARLFGESALAGELARMLDVHGISFSCRPARVAVALQQEGADPVAALVAARRVHPGVPAVFVATRGSEALAIAALRAGADDYFHWPSGRDQLVDYCLRAELPPDRRPKVPVLLGSSAVMCALRETVARVAARPCSVLIAGETGTGKDIVARLLHQSSARATRPFATINCAAVPEGLFESELFGYERGAFTGATTVNVGRLQAAAGGTVFLDEVGELPLSVQPKLLRAIEQGELQRLGSRGHQTIDVRWTAASNRDLARRADAGLFRWDLLYRLNVCTIEIPALRDRREDIVPLAQAFLDELAPQYASVGRSFTADALARLTAYDWPGNVRELRNAVEGGLARSAGGEIGVADLPSPIGRTLITVASVEASERHRIVDALRACGGNKSEAAHRLQWSRMTLYRKLSRYQLDVTDCVTL